MNNPPLLLLAVLVFACSTAGGGGGDAIHDAVSDARHDAADGEVGGGKPEVGVGDGSGEDQAGEVRPEDTGDWPDGPDDAGFDATSDAIDAMVDADADVTDETGDVTDVTDGGGEVDVEPDIPPQACDVGQPCDDLDPCTVDDSCVDGWCEGTPYGCDDGRWCTLDACDGLGNCEYTLKVGKCLLNGICAKSGDAKPGDVCLFCDPDKSPYEWVNKQFSPCSDGNACTTGDKCFDGVCLGKAAFCADDNPCTQDICDEELGCIFPPANAECDDGDPCTALDFCLDGECHGGFAPPCDDGNPCTMDNCMPGKGCVYSKLDGTFCDDDDACTVGDGCVLGECVPGPGHPVCDDWNECTKDVCDPKVGCTFSLFGHPCCINDIHMCDDGDPCTYDDCDVSTGACLYSPNDGPCNDKDACTTGDTCVLSICHGEPLDCDDKNPCTLDFCHQVTGCLHEPLNQQCDDGSVCTLGDWCKDGKCAGTKLNCNDYNPCTDDFCDPAAGCQNAPNTLPCSDQDLCTDKDVCTQGKCMGQAKSCDDGNPCTTDSCKPSVGCQNLFNQAACSDGDECTDGDHCAGGQCVPGTVVCASCSYEFSDAANRVTVMKIGKDNKAGNALDVDGNGTLDNSMAGLASLINGPLQDSLDKGTVHLLFEHHPLKADGNLYTLAVFVADLGPGYEQCDYKAAYCGYAVDSSAIDPQTCTPEVLFDNATLYKGKLSAGGKKYKFPWQIPLAEGTVLNIVLNNAMLQADAVVQQGVVKSMKGILAGAIPKQQFLDAINAVPPEQLPLPKDMVVQLIQVMVVNDIDTDGNGSKDAASIAIGFEAIPAGITGTK